MAPAGRRPGQNETRDAILDAARRQFASQGYDGATVRSIAAEAEVNAALLHHFYGTKQKLFVAALDLPDNPADMVPVILAGPDGEIGERLVRVFLGIWAAPQSREPFLAMLRSAATNDQVATMFRQFIDKAVLSKVAEARGIPRIRVAAAAAQMIGMAMLRYIIGIPPLVEATDEEIVTLLAPVIQHYFDVP